MAKVSALDLAFVSLQLARPITTPIHHFASVECVLVTLGTDAGVSGIAYLWCFGREKARVLGAMVGDLYRLVAGTDPTDRTAAQRRMWGDTNFFGRSGVAVFGLSALDIALCDLDGKFAGEPLHRRLGAATAAVPVYAGGLFLSDPLDAITAEADGYVRAGFTAMKMRDGSARWQDDVARVEAVRSVIGAECTLMVDAVQGWTVEQAVRVGRELERFDLAWIEDPLLFEDHAGLAEVAAALVTPVCAGENDYGLTGFRRLIDAKAIDVAMIDLQRVGGISEWLRVAHLAASRRMTTTPHVFHEISSHLACAVEGAAWLEYVPWWDRLFAEPVVPHQGCVNPPTGPGLGLAFDWDGLEGFRFG